MWKLSAMGEAAVLAECGIGDIAIANQHAVALARRLAAVNGINTTLGINSIVACFNPLQHANNDVMRVLNEAVASLVLREEGEQRIVHVQVRYGGEDGPDFSDAAQSLGMTSGELVALHTAQPWRVLMIGFAPGFPYIGPLPPALHLPRRSTPRPAVPAGSVAIAAGLTGIYPARLPGGWHLLGRTELELFNAQRRAAGAASSR